MHKIFMQKKEQFISAKIAPRTFQNQNSRILIPEPSFKKYKQKRLRHGTQYQRDIWNQQLLSQQIMRKMNHNEDMHTQRC